MTIIDLNSYIYHISANQRFQYRKPDNNYFDSNIVSTISIGIMMIKYITKIKNMPIRTSKSKTYHKLQVVIKCVALLCKYLIVIPNLLLECKVAWQFSHSCLKTIIYMIH